MADDKPTLIGTFLQGRMVCDACQRWASVIRHPEAVPVCPQCGTVLRVAAGWDDVQGNG